MGKKASDSELEIQRNITAELAKQAKLKRELASTSQSILDSEEDIVDYGKLYLENIKASKVAQAEIEKLMSEQIAHDKYMVEAAIFLTEEDKKQYDAQSLSYKLQIKQAIKLKEEFDYQAQINDLTEEQIELKQKQLAIDKERQKLVDKYKDSIEEQLGFIDSIDDKIKSIPVVGGVVSKALGLDKIKSELTDKLTNNVIDLGSTMKDTFTTAGGGIRGLGMAAKSSLPKIATMGTTLMAALAPVLPILLAIGAAILAFKAMQFFVDAALEADVHITDIAKNLNISKDAAAELRSNMASQGVLFENIVKYSEQLHTNFGQAGAVLANDVIPRMQALQHNMQLSDEHIGSLVTASTLLGTSFSGTVTTASEFETAAINATKQFYEQRGIQITNADLMSDVRENMQLVAGISKKSLAVYGKSADTLFKQVQNIRKLGLEFEQTVKISERVLDIESSIQKEMEANVILGKRFNFNQIRAAALYGDQEQLASEVTKQFEQQNISLERFNDMMPLQKKALSEAIGLGEDEIQQMLLRQKLEANLTKERYKQLLLDIKSGKTTAAELAKKGLITEQEAQQLIIAERRTTVQQDLQMIQDQLTQSIKANLPGIQSFIKVLADFGTSVQKAGGLKNYVLGKGEEQLARERFVGENVQTNIGESLPAQLLGMSSTTGTKGTITEIRPFQLLSSLGLEDAFKIAITEDETGSVGVKIGSQGLQDDFISRPGQPPISFNKDDIIIGATNPFGGGTDNSNTDALLAEQNELLKQLIASTNQPTLIQIGNRTIEEIGSKTGMRRNYTTTGIGNTYGKTLPGY